MTALINPLVKASVHIALAASALATEKPTEDDIQTARSELTAAVSHRSNLTLDYVTPETRNAVDDFFTAIGTAEPTQTNVAELTKRAWLLTDVIENELTGYPAVDVSIP